jgi:hypothetical protein
MSRKGERSNPMVARRSNLVGLVILPLLVALTAGTRHLAIAQPLFSAAHTQDTCFGTALEFDGIDDELSISHSGELWLSDTGFTIEAWVATTQVTDGTIVDNFSWLDPPNGYQIGISSGKVIFRTTHSDLISTSYINDGQWHHIAVAFYTPQIKRIFIDGVLDASTTTVWGFQPNRYGYPLRVGHESTYTSYFRGIIDEIRVWDFARTQFELQSTIYSPLVGNEPGLVGYWKLDEGDGQIAHDGTANGNDGQLGFDPIPDDGDPTWSMCQERIALSAEPPAMGSVGSLVYVPISLTDVLTSDDLRGMQFSIETSNPVTLSPAGDQPLRMGDLFPSPSLTYTVAMTDRWDFMLTAPLSPTQPVSGTGIVVELPFYAHEEGCVELAFGDHLLVDGDVRLINHQTQSGQICVGETGNLSGMAYLQSRATGHFTGTLVTLEGQHSIYSTTTDAAGNFAFTDIYTGVYTATFTHPLYVYALRTDIAVSGQIALPEVGLWAGDLNEDGDVDEPDWYICAAASIPVDDPAFDINDDHATDIRDCTILAGNIGRADMPITNPPKIEMMTLAQSMPNLAAGYNVGRIIAIPQGDGGILLRVVDVSGQLYAAGVRLDLPTGATITGIESRDGFAGGFLRWHQDNDTLYIVAAPRESDTLMRDTDMALIHITGGGSNEVIIEAQSSVGKERPFLIFLPVVMRQ